jgi:hypothetical protein
VRALRWLPAVLTLAIAARAAGGPAEITRTLPAAGTPQVLFPILDHDRWGFIDSTGRIAIPPRFESTVAVEAERAMTESESGKPRESDFFMAPGVGPESTWAIGVRTGGRWGFVDQRGTLLGSQRFDAIESWSDGLAAVRVGERWGFADASGRLSLAALYDDAARFTGGLCVVTVDGLRGIIDADGQWLAKPRFQSIEADDSVFHDNRAVVGMEGQKGYVSRAGTVAIPPMFDDAFPFGEGLAAVVREGRAGYIDTAGRMVIAPRFESAERFEAGVARVWVAGKIGLIDRSGALVARAQYDEIGSFAGGERAPAIQGAKRGTIDRTGRWRENDYDEFLVVNDSLAVGRIGTSTGLVRRADGRLLRPYEWDEIDPYSEGLAAARNVRGGYAFIDPLGAVVIPPRFDEVARFRHGLCRVAAGDTLGYIGRDGAWIWRQRYKGYHKRAGG